MYGVVGTEYVAKSSPDGYTLLATPSAFVMNAALYNNTARLDATLGA